MGRTLVGRRGLVPGVGGLGQLGLSAGEPVGEAGGLAGELKHGPVLLLDVSLEEGEAFFEVAQTRVHARDDADRRKRGKPMPARYDDYDRATKVPLFRGCAPK